MKRHVLVPDENTAGIDRFIYEKYIETENYAAVDELNRREATPPYIYKKTGSAFYDAQKSDPSKGSGYKGWDKSAVERILKSETYAGTLVQGKTSRIVQYSHMEQLTQEVVDVFIKKKKYI